MSNYQYPHLSHSEKEMLKTFGNSSVLEKLFAIKKWRAYYLSAFKRAVRTYSERHSHISFKGHIDLPPEFAYQEEKSVPRGNQVYGKYFSRGYEMALAELPQEIRSLILSFRGILQSYFACEAYANKAQFWRNLHVPPAIAEEGAEVFADAFH
jgi:hypothetical protein